MQFVAVDRGRGVDADRCCDLAHRAGWSLQHHPRHVRASTLPRCSSPPPGSEAPCTLDPSAARPTATCTPAGPRARFSSRWFLPQTFLQSCPSQARLPPACHPRLLRLARPRLVRLQPRLHSPRTPVAPSSVPRQVQPLTRVPSRPRWLGQAPSSPGVCQRSRAQGEKAAPASASAGSLSHLSVCAGGGSSSGTRSGVARASRR